MEGRTETHIFRQFQPMLMVKALADPLTHRPGHGADRTDAAEDGAEGTHRGFPHERSAMLALTRRVGEEVVIGDPGDPLGMIRVVEIHGDKVRLSFDFPKEVKINRKELAEQKVRQRENPDQAAHQSP